MFIDIQKTYNKIEKDIITNQTEIFYRYNYYTHKYRGDRLNDINVGLFLNDNLQPVVQIFVRNKTGYIKTHLIFNRAGNKIINKTVFNENTIENIN
jgi:hypothetical protein